MAEEEIVAQEVIQADAEDSDKKDEDEGTVAGSNQWCKVWRCFATCFGWIADKFTSCWEFSKTPFSFLVTKDQTGRYGAEFKAGKDALPKEPAMETAKTLPPTAATLQQPQLTGAANVRFIDESDDFNCNDEIDVSNDGFPSLNPSFSGNFANSEVYRKSKSKNSKLKLNAKNTFQKAKDD